MKDFEVIKDYGGIEACSGIAERSKDEFKRKINVDQSYYNDKG